MKELLVKRQSIRKYTTEKISVADIDYIVECMLLSPSGKNKHPWEFIVVHDVETIKCLADSKKAGANFLKDTQHLIVVVGNEEASDTWVEDASITMMVGHLAATTLNLGSCWIQTRNRDAENETSESYVKRVLGIPERLRVLAMLSLGHPVKVQEKEKKIDKSKVFLNNYGEAFYE